MQQSTDITDMRYHLYATDITLSGLVTYLIPKQQSVKWDILAYATDITFSELVIYLIPKQQSIKRDILAYATDINLSGLVTYIPFDRLLLGD